MSRLPVAVAVAVAGAALAGGIISPAGAVSRQTPRPHPLVAVAGPIRQEVTATPGKSVPVRFNIGDPSLTVPLRVTLAEGAIRELSNGILIPAPVPAAERGWLRFPRPSMLLPPGNVAVFIAARLTVPVGTAPGDYAIAGAFSVRRVRQPLTSTGARLLPVVYAELVVSVPGAAGSGVAYSLRAASGLHIGGPVLAVATVRNIGFRVEALNGLRVTGDGAAVRLDGALLLPGATRTYRVELGGTCAPCHVTFASAARSVWIIPPALLLAVVLAVAGAAVVLMFWRIRRRARRLVPVPVPEPTDPATEVLKWN